MDKLILSPIELSELMDSFRSIVKEEIKAFSKTKAQDQESEELLTATEAAKYLGVSINTVYCWLQKNDIPSMRPGGRKLYFSKDELNKWVKRSKRKSNGELKEEADHLICKPKKNRA